MDDNNTHNVVQRLPYIYLRILGKWYCYDSNSQPLGGGAMGTVYMGYELDKNGNAVRTVAVKRVKDAYANVELIRKRARWEASLAFRHPNLVEMVGYCEAAPRTGPIFLVSNYVNGENIDQYVKRIGDTQDRVHRICHLLLPVLDALQYLHTRGVIHRDIKPSNIMVEDNSNVRLMDLGIARLNGGNQFSQIGFIGTPEYSAPEQILRQQGGGFVEINASTDIYEFGITFYELLTGSNPMKGSSDAETLVRQMKNALPADPRIPKKLMKVILKATDKEQSMRYQTAADFQQAIEDALQPDMSVFLRLQNWLSSHIVVAVALVLAFIAILAALIFIVL